MDFIVAFKELKPDFLHGRLWPKAWELRTFIKEQF